MSKLLQQPVCSLLSFIPLLSCLFLFLTHDSWEKLFKVTSIQRARETTRHSMKWQFVIWCPRAEVLWPLPAPCLIIDRSCCCRYTGLSVLRFTWVLFASKSLHMLKYSIIFSSLQFANSYGAFNIQLKSLTQDKPSLSSHMRLGCHTATLHSVLSINETCFSFVRMSL